MATIPNDTANRELVITRLPLAAGGKVTIPLEHMFRGAYFGSCTDKFEVQWMINCLAK